VDKSVYPGSRIARLPTALQPPATVVRGLVRRVRWLPTEAADRVLGRNDSLTPPRRLQRLGRGTFAEVGEQYVRSLRELADLQPTDRVLDIGCGIGRVARPLTRELRPPGSYDGFDIRPDAIAWCQDRYRQTPAPFRFRHCDVHNTAYNPDSLQAASEFTFPYADGAFDVAIAISVFTHLLPENADRYLSEASRVLAPGGRMLLTWFLLTDPPPPAPALDFHAVTGVAATIKPDSPEAAIAYLESWLRDRIAAYDLTLRGPIHYGSWRGTPGRHFQDIVVLDGPA
jgi:ubiquinone/menaquinone biosynthesis C-methylase UbiE